MKRKIFGEDAGETTPMNAKVSQRPSFPISAISVHECPSVVPLPSGLRLYAATQFTFGPASLVPRLFFAWSQSW